MTQREQPTPQPAKGCPHCRGLGVVVGADGGLANGALCSCVVLSDKDRAWFKDELRRQRVAQGLKTDVGPDDAPDNVWCLRCMDTGRFHTGGRWVRCRCKLLPDRIALYNRIRLPARHGSSTFSSWNMALPDSTPDCVRLMTWAKDFKPGANGFVLWGPVGRGKTHLLSATLREIVFEHGARARFVEFTHLLSELKASFEQRNVSSASILDEVMDCDVLAIDELGKGRSTEWELQVLDELVSRAYNAQTTLVATTNYMPGSATGRRPSNLALVGSGSDKEKADAQTLGDRVGDRVYSRLAEMASLWPIGLARTDHRRES